MQKWEYLFVTNQQTVYYDNDAYPSGYVRGNDLSRTYTENGQESDGADLEDWEVANQIGEKGWELVSVEQGRLWKMVFKRPKQ